MKPKTKPKRHSRLLPILSVTAIIAYVSFNVSLKAIFIASPPPRDLLLETRTSLSQQAQARSPLNPIQSVLSTPKNGSFVHVGKTAGSTVSILLRNGCHSFMPHPCREVPMESIVSLLIQSYYHVPDFGKLKDSHHDFYALSCRDPFDRTVSAFVFDHINNRYARNETIDPWKVEKYMEAYRCFPTLQDYVELLGEDSKQFSYLFTQRSVNADSCPDLARAAFHGRVKLYSHLFFSFQRIQSLLPSDHEYDLYAVRKEFLWKDWKSLNGAFGQPETSVFIPPESQSQRRNVTDDRMPVKRTLNEHGRSLLCRALEDEYRVYFSFLNRAKNLNSGDLELSIQVARRNCPMLAIRRLAGPLTPTWTQR